MWWLVNNKQAINIEMKFLFHDVTTAVQLKFLWVKQASVYFAIPAQTRPTWQRTCARPWRGHAGDPQAWPGAHRSGRKVL